MVKFRYNNYDRATPHFSPSDTLRFYQAWQHLSTIIRSPQSEIRIPLRPGSVIFINNERCVRCHQGIDIDGIQCDARSREV